MTRVLLALDRPDASGVDVPAPGSVEFRPTLRRTVDGVVVLPDAFSAPIGTVVDLAPTGPSWCWRAVERVRAGIERYVIVPDTDVVVAYADLTDVDPATLEPTAEPSASWWAYAEGTREIAVGALVEAMAYTDERVAVIDGGVL